jgi:hypothetical protein
MAPKRRSAKHASTIHVRAAGGGKFNYAYQGPRPGQWDELEDLSAQEIFRKVAAILKMYPRTVVVLPKYTLGPRLTAVRSGQLPFVVYSEPHGQEVMADNDPKELWAAFGNQLLRGVRNIKKPESGRPVPGWEDRNMDLNDLMSELRGEPVEELTGIPTKNPGIRDYANATAVATMYLEKSVKKVGDYAQGMFERGTHPGKLEKEHGDFASVALEYAKGALVAVGVAKKALSSAGAALAFIAKRRDNSGLRSELKKWEKVAQQMNVNL